MVTDRVIGASDVGKTFAEAVKADDAVVGIWARRHREVFEIWLLTEQIEAEHERSLYEAVRVLHDAFPYAFVRVYLLNPANFDYEGPESMVGEEVPESARLIYSRRE